MKPIRILSLLILAVLLAACGAAPTAAGPELPARKVIIDTDTGADDASALILAAKSGAVDILGVTTLAGNVDLEQSTKNALMALELGDSDAPVYKGAAEILSGRKIDVFSVFGADGLGNAGLIHPERKAEEQDAASFILDTVRQAPGQVEIIMLGPATNVARAIERSPETMKQVKMLWSMGSAGLGPGNASPVAEFNVYNDAEAYRRVLDSGIPITVVGLDMCGGDAMWTDKQYDKLEKTNAVGSFVSRSFQKLRDFYEQNGSADAAMNCDSIAMMCALYPDFAKESVQAHGSCVTDPGESYGQVIFYKEGFTYDAVTNDYDYNVTLITDVPRDEYFSRYLKTIQK